MAHSFDLKPVTKKASTKSHDKYNTIFNYKSDPTEFLDDYHYQPKLTKNLDELNNARFNQELLNKIVLWKLNRYVALGPELFKELDSLTSLERGAHRKCSTILIKLLNNKGADLPMASTILRFRNPEVFQIIDRHAYRAVYGRKYPLYPMSSIRRKTEVYFDYLDKLLELSKNKNLEYRTLDRLLYQFDKQLNGKL